MAPVDYDDRQTPDDKAPRCRVRDKNIVNIEHPCIIRNVDRGVKSLGGPERLNDFLNLGGATKSIGVSLRPDDALAKPIASRRASRNDLLLRVTVPKRTGRKRKRGSDESYEKPVEGTVLQPIDSPQVLLRSMRDNVHRYSIEVAGSLRESHRFRSIPDSQYAASTNSMMTMLRDSLLHLDPERIKRFKFAVRVPPGEDVGPPAHFTSRETHDIPNVYSYKQNATVEVSRDQEGNITTRNVMKIKQHFNHEIEPDADTVPQGIPPGADLEPESRQPARVQGYIKRIREAMAERPIMTKRYISDLLSSTDNDTRYAWAYCGYVFRSGPWRDALVKFGVDPRRDASLRKYQCLMFKIEKGKSSNDGVKQRWQHYGEKEKAPEGVKGYQFDGKTLVADGKVYQMCDITDPVLKAAVDTPYIRQEFSPGDGWYHNGTLAKIRIIMKHKLDLCAAGKVPEENFYVRLASFPDHIPSGPDGTQFWRQLIASDGRGPPSKEEQELSEKIRTLASAARDKRKARTYQTRGKEDEEDEDDAPSVLQDEGEEQQSGANAPP